MLDSIFSIAAGGVTGLLGSAVSVVGDLFKGGQKNRHEREMRKLDLEMMDREAK